MITNYTNIVANVYSAKRIKIFNSNKCHLIWSTDKENEQELNFNVIKNNKNSLSIINPFEVFIGDSRESYFKVIVLDDPLNVFLRFFFITTFNSEIKDGSIFNFTEQESKKVDNCIIQIFKAFEQKEKNNLHLDDLMKYLFSIRINKTFEKPLAFAELIETEYKSNHLVSFYAEELELPPKSLLAEMKKYGFKKPGVLICERVLLEAKILLVFTDKRVNEICFELGFDDPAYFARFFKKHTSTTATKFRENSRKRNASISKK